MGRSSPWTSPPSLTHHHRHALVVEAQSARRLPRRYDVIRFRILSPELQTLGKTIVLYPTDQPDLKRGPEPSSQSAVSPQLAKRGSRSRSRKLAKRRLRAETPCPKLLQNLRPCSSGFTVQCPHTTGPPRSQPIVTSCNHSGRTRA